MVIIADQKCCDNTTFINYGIGEQDAALQRLIEVAEDCLPRLVWPTIESCQ